jgi:exodeoxyribonuclease V alpha subunit
MLVGVVRQMIGGVDKADVAKAIARCHKEGTLVLDRETKPGTMAVYEPWMYHLESEGARMLKDRITTARVEDDPDAYRKALASVGPDTELASKEEAPLRSVLETAVFEWGQHAKLALSEDQREGVLNALLHPVSILTGLPGTGKTTSLRAAVRILQDARIPFLLCAPTGIAAKNLGSLTGARASTIHRAFSAKGSSDDKRDSTYTGIVGDASKGSGGQGDRGVWGYDQDRPYPAEVVIVDEASMVDSHLLYRLVDCTSPTCRLVFVGDHAQLPSVGPGNVLRNLIESECFPTVKLTEIFRQKKQSDIVHAAHAIHRGEVPETKPPSDFVLLPFEDEEDVRETVCRLAEKLYDKRANFQVLSPRHAGTVGVTNLNASLRSLLNPPGTGIKEHKVGNDVIREDDRVMVVKNNYEKGVFNGDVGKVTRIDRRAKEVEVKIFGDPPFHVRFKFSDMGKYIRLAYACTVHKAQGLEYDVIVMPIVSGFRHQLQRNLLYTAVTRAKSKVFLVGTHRALARAIANDKEDLRDTLLVERLRDRME